MPRVAFYFDGQLMWADRKPQESPLAAITRSVARRVGGAGLTVWYDHAATLTRGDGHDVHVAKWFDVETDVFQEHQVVT